MAHSCFGLSPDCLAGLLGCSSFQLYTHASGAAFSGGMEEADAAYEEALNAIFVLSLDCHRHTQPHKSKKTGLMKWAMIEMWPMTVSNAAQLCMPVAVQGTLISVLCDIGVLHLCLLTLHFMSMHPFTVKNMLGIAIYKGR